MSRELVDDQQPPPAAPPAADDAAYIEWEGHRYSRLAVQAAWAYARELAQLLQERPGQWVAYHGKERVGFAQTSLALYQECLARGYRQGDFIVYPIEPEVPGVVLPPEE
jgi:hypothetical protein